MSFIFENQKNREKLKSVVDSWRATPFISHTQLKNVGCDCVTFAHGVYSELGLLDPYFTWPRYPLRSGGELFFIKICKEVETHALEVDSIEVGDLLVFSTGKAIHHVGIALSTTQFVHCMDGFGIINSSINDTTFGSRLKKIFRFVDKGVLL